MERCSRRIDSDDIYKMEALITAVVHTSITSYMRSKFETMAAQKLHSPR